LGIRSDWDHASESQGVNFPEVRQSREGTPKASATRWKKANQAVMHTASEISSSFYPATRNCATSSGESVGGVGYQFHIVQQSTLRRGKARFVRLAFDGGFYALLGCSLDPQEVAMGCPVNTDTGSDQKRSGRSSLWGGGKDALPRNGWCLLDRSRDAESLAELRST
jgi:hypothetical protein